MSKREKLPGIAGSVLAIALLAAPAHGSVDDVGATGFAVTETAQIGAPPDRVYEAMIEPSRWWSPDHTYSHDAANLTLDAKAGGCWCETLPGGGSVQHLVVVNAMPGRVLRLRGALGPLQSMAVDGALTLSVRAANKGTLLTMTYTTNRPPPALPGKWVARCSPTTENEMNVSMSLGLYAIPPSPHGRRSVKRLLARCRGAGELSA
jgi:uncharacterized protein YndB with AHSA1/START domain